MAPMRRALIGQRDLRAAIRFALGLALHQHPGAIGQPVDLGALRADDIGQVVNRPDQMGDAFFEVFDTGHAP